MHEFQEKIDRFEQAWALITNFYPEALLIVRDHEKGKNTRWRSTDATWAIGAAMRYVENTEASDFLDLQNRTNSEAENG